LVSFFFYSFIYYRRCLAVASPLSERQNTKTSKPRKASLMKKKKAAFIPQSSTRRFLAGAPSAGAWDDDVDDADVDVDEGASSPPSLAFLLLPACFLFRFRFRLSDVCAASSPCASDVDAFGVAFRCSASSLAPPLLELELEAVVVVVVAASAAAAGLADLLLLSLGRRGLEPFLRIDSGLGPLARFFCAITRCGCPSNAHPIIHPSSIINHHHLHQRDNRG
jgi:hypothetical protein